ncbi:MAG: 50S ribosomal protein L22 [bacterium]
MRVKAQTKWVRNGARKLSRVAQLLRGMPAVDALNMLEMMPNKSAEIFAKLVKAAIANAKHNFKLSADSLIVDEAFSNKGVILKRWRARARGRVGSIHKPTSHATVWLKSVEKVTKPALPAGREAKA